MDLTRCVKAQLKIKRMIVVSHPLKTWIFSILMMIQVLLSSCGRYHYIQRASVEHVNKSRKPLSIPVKISAIENNTLVFNQVKIIKTCGPEILKRNVNFEGKHSREINFSVLNSKTDTVEPKQYKRKPSGTIGILAGVSGALMIISFFGLLASGSLFWGFLFGISCICSFIYIGLLVIILLIKLLHYIFGDVVSDPDEPRSKRTPKLKNESPQNNLQKAEAKKRKPSPINFIFIYMLLSNMVVWTMSRIKNKS
jgi:hypothetical protein